MTDPKPQQGGEVRVDENCQAFTLQETNDSLRLYFRSGNNEVLTIEEANEVIDVIKDILENWSRV